MLKELNKIFFSLFSFVLMRSKKFSLHVFSILTSFRVFQHQYHEIPSRKDYYLFLIVLSAKKNMFILAVWHWDIVQIAWR